MQQPFAQKLDAVVIMSRKILTNSAAGLISAGLLGFCSPFLKPIEPQARFEAVDMVNVDPVSGKILDRIPVAEAGPPDEPAAPHEPLLVGYAPPDFAAAAQTESAPPKLKGPRDVSVRGDRLTKAQKASRSDPESRNMPAGAPAAPLAPAPADESQGWTSKPGPAALSAKLAPIGDYVSSGALAAKHAVLDRLEAIGF